jgi:hypothetical protein
VLKGCQANSPLDQLEVWGTKREAERRKSFRMRERTSLRCPPERLVQTYKLSIAIETMICALRMVCKSRLERDNFRSVYERL